MKKNVYLMVLLLLSFLAFGQEQKSFNLNFEHDFKLEDTNRDHKGQKIQQISFAGDEIITNSEKTGMPNLPWISINILVPNGADFLDAKLIKNATSSYQNVVIEAVQQTIPVSYTGSVDYIYPDYASKEQTIYPKENVKFTGISKLSTYTIFNFLVSPFEYNTTTKDLVKIDDFTLELNYELGNDLGSVKKWDNGDFYEIVKNLVINKNEIPLPQKRGRAGDDVDHLIITNNALSSSFQALADHRTANGLVSQVISTETIYATYTGATNQLKIKNCIKDFYENRGLKWVAIGGDDTIVPDQNTYGIVNDNPEYDDFTIPTDLFYACFDNQFDWNATDDDKIGNTDDNVDMSPEVFIGRIPVRTASHVTAYVTKMIDYELNPPTDIATKFLMTGCKLWEPVGSVSDAEAKSEALWDDFIDGNWEGGTKYSLYDTNTDFAGGASYDLTASNLQDQINEGYGFIHMATHGNQNLWSTESGNYYYSSNALAQTNSKMGIIATMACITNAFDCDAEATIDNCSGGPYMTDPSLSEGFLRNPNGGAVGYLGSSRYGWGYSGGTASHGPSLQYNDQFFYRLFTGQGQTANTEKRFGAVSALAKMDYISSASGNGATRWIMYTLNTMGDPALKIITDEGDLSCTITSPLEGAVITPASIITIKANAADLSKSVSLVEFFIDNEKIGEDSSAPYTFDWDTDSYSIGHHTVKIIATDNETNTATSQITVNLNYPESTLYSFPFDSDNESWTVGTTINEEWTWGAFTHTNIENDACIWVDSDAAGSGISCDTWVISPVLDLSGEFSDSQINFDRIYRKLNCSLTFEYSIDGGTNWLKIDDMTAQESWENITYTIPEEALTANTQFGFHYISEYDWYAAFDNFAITVRTNPNPNSIVENNLPLSTMLEQNYPNPFNPTTTIKFFNRLKGDVKLTVYNVKGELVKTLINNQVQKSGYQTVQFDASRFNSGVYYYRLETPEKAITKKMLLVK